MSNKIPTPSIMLPHDAPYNIVAVSTEDEQEPNVVVRPIYSWRFSYSFPLIYISALTLAPHTTAHITSNDFPVYLYNIKTGEMNIIQHTETGDIGNKTDLYMVWLAVSGLEHLPKFVPFSYPLNPYYVEKGFIDEQTLWSHTSDNGKVAKASVLTMHSCSKTRMHSHPEEETFINLFTGECRYYGSNIPHYLDNEPNVPAVWAVFKGFSSLIPEFEKMK